LRLREKLLETWPKEAVFWCAPTKFHGKLMSDTRPRLWSMFTCGTTTAEVKTGYGLRTAAELRMLQALLALDKEGPLEITPTFWAPCLAEFQRPMIHSPDLQYHAADP
jgi:imidazolonepropionase-like amidohydrolase